MKHLNYIFMIIAAILLGTIGVLVKTIGDAIPVMTLNFYRLFFAFLFLVMVVPFIDKKWHKISKQDAKEYFIIGVLYAISLSLYTAANRYAPVQNVVLINYSYPFFVLLFGYFLIKEKITTTKIITLIISSIGLAVINPFQFGEGTFGNVLALIGAVFYGLLITEMRKEDEGHTIGDVIWFLMFGSLVLLPFPFIYGFGDFMSVWPLLLILGFLSTGLAYLLYNLALQKIEAEICSMTATILTPLVSIALAIIILSESLSTRTLIGGSLLIIAGIYLETHNKEIK